jgi:DNA-binding response OmpR family regulator
MPRRTILVIEDDAAIRRGVLAALSAGGYQVLEAADGDRGLERALHDSYDLLLLDLVLPGKQGLEILKELKSSRPGQPVIVLTAKGDESDRVAGLKFGADDYVVKPFGVKELLARVEAVLRRSPERPLDVEAVKFPGGWADLARREIRYEDGGRVELTEREAELLRYLAVNPQRAIAREELLERVWRLEARNLETRTIDMCIARLREKLRDDPEEPTLIQTVRGKGYRFSAEQAAKGRRGAASP